MKLFEVALQHSIEGENFKIEKPEDIFPFKKKMLFLSGDFEMVASSTTDFSTTKENTELLKICIKYYPTAAHYDDFNVVIKSNTFEYSTLKNFIDDFSKWVKNTPATQKNNDIWAYILEIEGIDFG